MSTDSPVPESQNREQSPQQEVGTYYDGDVDTPKSDLPPSLWTRTENPAHHLHGQQEHDAVARQSDYFTLHPAPPSSTSISAPLTHELSTRASPVTATIAPGHSLAARAYASDATASGHIEPPDATYRPHPYTTPSSLSVESTASSVTVRQSVTFPNQAFSALHTQQHPPYHIPPAYRRGGIQNPPPHHIATFTSAIASLHSSGVRTAHNSPAVTPGTGLFSPPGISSAPATEGSEGSGPGTYASPFLHFSHTHVPKETHVADVDVDPVSGRKLINSYEIIDELGRGTHGKVKLGRDLTSAKDQPIFVAIKIVERFSKRRKLGRLGTTEDKVKKEVAILKKARHPNVVALLEVIDDPSRKKVYIVLEWVEKGEINWRAIGPKEIGMLEARRYGRERSGHQGDLETALDAAVLAETQKRLARRKRQQIKDYRLMKRGAVDMPEAWSIELAGDNESLESEDDRLSRISSRTAYSDTGRLSIELGPQRRALTPSSWHPSVESGEDQIAYTSEPETISQNHEQWQQPKRPSSAFSDLPGIGGTYESNNYKRRTSRVESTNSVTSSRGTVERLARTATEILDSYLDPELEHVPVMTMEQIRVAFRDTVLGLQYLHYQGIVHRDIKPPNLLTTADNRVKISDFGVSYLGRPTIEGEAAEDVSEAEAQDLGDEAKELAKTVGTPAFYAPELCITDLIDDPPPVTKAIDVWALGVTLFCMLFARTPFVDNEFVVMRQIADEDIYLPRKRLQPLDTKPKSRPSSHTRASVPTVNGRRHEFDLAYEEINDELHDLLERLLIKDPRKRITLEEVRHHPWVLSDLPNKIKWLEDTDPSRQAEGKKIEISKEELNTAVVPLNLVERMRSGLKKVFEKTGITRTRGQSGTSKDGSPVPSAGSSSSTISQDVQRQSLRGEESIYTALKASRDGGHPLSSSVVTSPEMDRTDHDYFDQEAAKMRGFGADLARIASRPSAPQRTSTVASTAGSLRTVTQSDFQAPTVSGSPPLSPGLPGTPRELASPGGSNLSGLLGGPSRLIKTVRERTSQRFRYSRGPASESGSLDSSDVHGEASLAVSSATAAGHVLAPDSLREVGPTSGAHSTPPSRAISTTPDSQRHHQASKAADGPGFSRMSSSDSFTLLGLGRTVSNPMHNSGRQRSWKAPESAVEDWRRADDEPARRLVRDNESAEEDVRSSLRGPFGGYEFSQGREDAEGARQKRGDSRSTSIGASSNPDTPDNSTSPITQAGQMSSLISSSSDLGSAMSVSISNPSVPSAISEASSVEPLEGMQYEHDNDKHEALTSSDDTLNPRSSVHEAYDEGYTPDENAAFESGQEDDGYDSSDSDGGLIMRRKQSGHGLVLGLNAPKERRGTGLSVRSKRSSRSGSNNTMKKVRTRDSIDESRSALISE